MVVITLLSFSVVGSVASASAAFSSSEEAPSQTLAENLARVLGGGGGGGETGEVLLARTVEVRSILADRELPVTEGGAGFLLGEKLLGRGSSPVGDSLSSRGKGS